LTKKDSRITSSFPLARALVEGCKGGASCKMARIVRRNRRGAIVIVAAYGVLAESSAVADNIDNAKKC